MDIKGTGLKLMTKLNQIIAIEKGIKSRVYGEVTDLNKAVQKPELFNGFSKTYQSKDDDGERLPPESKRVQYQALDVLRSIARLETELMAVTARKDWTNTKAVADVVIDGKVLIEKAPVSYLLFLEKQLNDIRTLVSNVPVLDEAEAWVKDVNSGLFKSEATQTHRTKKIAKPIVLYPATPEHPAQTQMVSEDVIVGFWTNVKMSGALPKPEKLSLMAKVEKLIISIKEAREEANNQFEIDTPDVGSAIFSYLGV